MLTEIYSAYILQYNITIGSHSTSYSFSFQSILHKS